MKCQKCNTENINEAVKCGICGARLKHRSVINDSTSSQNVESSVRREGVVQKHSEQNKHQKSKPTMTTQANSKDGSIQGKAHILLKNWQDQAKKAFETQPKKKSLKWVWIIIAVFIFGPTVIGVFTRAIIPEIIYQFKQHQRSATVAAGENMDEAESAETTAYAEATAVDAVGSTGYTNIAEVVQPRYMDIQSFQAIIQKYYAEKKTMPKTIHDVEKFEDSVYSDYVYDDIEIKDGTIIGKFKLDPDKRIYSFPQIDRNKMVKWDCYSIGVKDPIFKECQYLEKDPFISN